MYRADLEIRLDYRWNERRSDNEEKSWSEIKISNEENHWNCSQKVIIGQRHVKHQFSSRYFSPWKPPLKINGAFTLCPIFIHWHHSVISNVKIHENYCVWTSNLSSISAQRKSLRCITRRNTPMQNWRRMQRLCWTIEHLSKYCCD